MIRLVAIGLRHNNGEQVYELRRDGEPGFGHLVTTPELADSLQAAIELASNIYAALHPDEETTWTPPPSEPASLRGHQ